MSNKFEIIVTAADKVTAVANRIDARMKRMLEPFDKLRKASVRMAEATGLAKIAESIGEIGKSAGEAGRRLREVAEPLAAITGAATIAGVAALAYQWAKLGSNVITTSRTLGVSTQYLQQTRGAAKLLGIDAQAADSSIESLGRTLEDALFGRNPEAYGILRQLGIGIHRTRDGAIDTRRAMTDLARAMNDPRLRGNPQAQGMLAGHFGVGALLPLLRDGPAAMQRLMDQAQKLGYAMDEEGLGKADRFAEGLRRLEVRAEGLRDKLGERLFPILMNGLERLEAWLDGGGLDRLINQVNSVAHAMGGWKVVGIALGAMLTAHLFAPVVILTGGLAKMVLVIGSLIPKLGGLKTAISLSGLGEAAAAIAVFEGAFAVGGVLNDWISSWIEKNTTWYDNPGASRGTPPGLALNNPGNLRRWGANQTVGGFAAFPSRMAGLTAMAQQLGLYGARGIDTLGGIIGTYAPAGDGNNVGTYIADVARQTGFGPNQHLDLGNASTLSTLMAAMIQHEQGQQPFGAGELGSAARAGALEVHIHGAAPGTTVTARTTGGARVPVRINHTLPGVG